MTINKEAPTGFTNVLISDNVGATLTRNPLVTGPKIDAILELQGSNGGLVLPRMSTVERNLLVAGNGMLVYDTTLDAVFSYEGLAGWVELASGAGSGDVDGPASSIDNHIATFNGLTGKVIKDSGALLTSSTTFAIREDGVVGGKLFIGSSTGDLTSAGNNIGIGFQALQDSPGQSGGDNIAIGRDALSDNTTGIHNIAIGTNALDSNLSSNNNTAIGYLSLGANTIGDNTAVGAFSMGLNNTGFGNTAVGMSALAANVVSNNNVAVGRNALLVNTAAGNTAVGTGALDANTIGIENVAVGNNALGANIDAPGNTAIGFESMLLTNDVNADSNTAVGSLSLRGNISGNQNVAVGYGAMVLSQLGASNVAIGAGSLASSVLANNSNTAVGFGSLGSLTTGSNNVAVGELAGSGQPSLSSCTFIGQATGAVIPGLTNATAIGAGALVGTNNTVALGDGCGALLSGLATMASPAANQSLIYHDNTVQGGDTRGLTVLNGNSARHNGVLVNAATSTFSAAPTAGTAAITGPATSEVIGGTAAIVGTSIVLVTLIDTGEPLQPVSANVTNPGEITVFVDSAPATPLNFQWFIINPAS